MLVWPNQSLGLTAEPWAHNKKQTAARGLLSMNRRSSAGHWGLTWTLAATAATRYGGRKVTVPTPTDPLEAIKVQLAFLYVAREELSEARRFAGAILKRVHVTDGGEHSTLEAKALDIALIVTYARPFTRNYGFNQVSIILSQAVQQLSTEQTEIHIRAIQLRDREYAHMDAQPLDVQVHFDNMFEFSKAVTREPLDPEFLDGIIRTAGILLEFINRQIDILRQEYRDAGGDVDSLEGSIE